MPQTNLLRYTTYANPRIRTNSAGYLVADTDLNQAQLLVPATIVGRDDNFQGFILNTYPVNITVTRENGYTGAIRISIGISVKGRFVELANTGYVDWTGDQTIFTKIPDTIDMFESPIEFLYKVSVTDPAFTDFSDKLIGPSGTAATFTVLSGLTAGVNLTPTATYQANLDKGFIDFVSGAEFGGNGSAYKYVISEYYSPSSLLDGNNAYLELKTSYSVDSGGVGNTFPPVVGVVRTDDPINYTSLTSATYLELGNVVERSYGTFYYAIPGELIGRGGIKFIVMDNTPVGEFISTTVISTSVLVEYSRPANVTRKIKKVVFDITALPLNYADNIDLTVIFGNDGSPIQSKTVLVSSSNSGVSVPVWYDYLGSISYILKDFRGRIIASNGNSSMAAREDVTTIRINPGNNIYKTLHYALVGVGLADYSIRTNQFVNPWSLEFIYDLYTEEKFADFNAEEIGLQFPTKPVGLEVTATPVVNPNSANNRQRYIVKVSNPAPTPVPNSTVPITVQPVRIAGIKRADVETFAASTISTNIYVTPPPTIPVFYPVQPGTELETILNSRWSALTVPYFLQIIASQGSWSTQFKNLNDSVPLKYGIEDGTTFGIGIVTTLNSYYTDGNSFRLEYGFGPSNPLTNAYFLKDYNSDGNTYTSRFLNTEINPVIQYSTPWYVPQSGAWQSVGYPSNLGTVPIPGYANTNLKLVNLGIYGPKKTTLEMLIWPDPTATGTSPCTAIKMFGKYR